MSEVPLCVCRLFHDHVGRLDTLSKYIIWHSAPCTLHPATLHPTLTPCTLHPTPYTLHPTLYTLHPTPYTLHPTPYNLHCSFVELGVCSCVELEECDTLARVSRETVEQHQVSAP